jgi:hypothetical protein
VVLHVSSPIDALFTQAACPRTRAPASVSMWVKSKLKMCAETSGRHAADGKAPWGWLTPTPPDGRGFLTPRRSIPMLAAN